MINILFYVVYGLGIATFMQYSDNIPEFRFSFFTISCALMYYFGEKLRKKLTKDK